MEGHSCNTSEIINLKYQPIILTIISSLASIVGSCLIMLSFVIWKDLRTTARAILVYLAIADLLTALGYLFASILFLVKYSEQTFHVDLYVFYQLCTFQSFITTAFPISSFLWTANLAVYLFVTITLKQVRVAKNLMIVFHLIAWGIPLLLCIPGAATHILGGENETSIQSQGTVGWCWVSFNRTFDNSTMTVRDVHERLSKLHLLELLFGKFWEIVVSVLAFVLCIIVKISLRKRVN